MNVVLRTPTQVVDSFDSGELNGMAIATVGYTIRKLTDLVMVHLGTCRVKITTVKNSHDYYSENLFAYTSPEGTVFIFMDDNFSSFKKIYSELPSKNRRQLAKMTDGLTVKSMRGMHGDYGAINLANVIKQTRWQQIAEIASQNQSKERK